MKCAAVLAAAATTLAACVSAAPQARAAETFKVPGENQLEYCDDPADYLLSVDRIDLKPVVPSAGQNLTISFAGTLAEAIEDKSYVLLEVKYGPYIKLVNERMDICENSEAVDKKCPIDGDVEVEKVVALPSVIPPGTYYVQADAYTGDDRRITCLKAAIKFEKPSSLVNQAAGLLHVGL